MAAWISSFFLLLGTANVDSPSGPTVLAKTQAYHDPNGAWMRQAVELRIETGYADGRTTVRVAHVNNSSADYRDRVERDGSTIEQIVEGDDCRFLVDGELVTDPVVWKALELSCDDAKRRRDYISYLWGLPMKLNDPGTRVDPVCETTEFQGRTVLDLTIRYDPDVGTDVWHMYVDPESGRLVGYAFYKSAAEEKGEYIVLEDELSFAGYRIPAKRHWYTIPGDEFLGTDTLLGGRLVD